ncbi:hypothetical protein HYH02_008918 [Chlamydomonas schloesseri]|uniref:Amine oxidase domain-containing protein n=1 Tax=Chlamydomonas schloesseri TaxID=2026947 RepID=A0A835WD74_9CHLO|nr:hypothetical protein HYH02_008918 [Chlamydomonas schloesseri]|eukprot:KAG2445050.1 hypothetical protein HYH02_008918 [Chlamydomonas schloesseri]
MAWWGRLAIEVWTAMQADLRAAMGIRPLNRPKYLSAHRWGSAFTTTPLGVPAVWEADGRWAAAGDFCNGAGVEHALTSGAAAAEAVAGMLGLPGIAGGGGGGSSGGGGGGGAAKR